MFCRRPTYLENFGNGEAVSAGTQLRRLRPGVVSGLLAPDEELTVIAVEDLGALAVSILERGPEAYGDRVLSAGAERITGASLAAAATRVHGEAEFEYRQVPWWVLEYLIPVDYPAQLRRWLSTGGNDEGAGEHAAASLRECRELHPEMLSVEDWLRAQGVQRLATPPLQRLKRAVADTTSDLKLDLPLSQGPALARRAALGTIMTAIAGRLVPAGARAIPSKHK